MVFSNLVLHKFVLIYFFLVVFLLNFFWQTNHVTKKQELQTSVQELASRAASRAKIEAAKSIAPPNSAYQFEVSWRGLSGDPALQAGLLKVCNRVLI